MGEGVLEQLMEGREELLDDHDDGAEEGVGAGFGAPGGEDGVGGFEDGDVEGEIGGGEGGDDLLGTLGRRKRVSIFGIQGRKNE